MVPSTEIEFAAHEEYGVEDPRICTIAGEHYITYSAYSRFGVRIGLAKTRDFKTVERVSLISQADMRNVVIFPDTFNGRYARLGSAPLGNQPLVHLAVLVSGPDSLG